MHLKEKQMVGKNKNVAMQQWTNNAKTKNLQRQEYNMKQPMYEKKSKAKIEGAKEIWGRESRIFEEAIIYYYYRNCTL